MKKTTTEITLRARDPLYLGRIQLAAQSIVYALDDMAVSAETHAHAAEDAIRTAEADLIITRLFCGVAFAAAQAMIDGVRVEG